MKSRKYFITDGTRYFKFGEQGKDDFDACLQDAYGFKKEKAAVNFLNTHPKMKESYHVICGRKKRRASISKTKRMLVFSKSDGRCAICGREISAESFTVDHIIPVVRGGSDNIKNLQATCEYCNKVKGSLTKEEFICKIREWFLYNQNEFLEFQSKCPTQEDGRGVMEKCKRMIMVSEERWDAMMATYDALVRELEETKKVLKEAVNSHKDQKPLNLEGGVK